jgi:hypothetical protein
MLVHNTETATRSPMDSCPPPPHIPLQSSRLLFLFRRILVVINTWLWLGTRRSDWLTRGWGEEEDRGKACVQLSLPPMGHLSVVSVCHKEKQNILDANYYIRQNTIYTDLYVHENSQNNNSTLLPYGTLQQNYNIFQIWANTINWR